MKLNIGKLLSTASAIVLTLPFISGLQAYTDGFGAYPSSFCEGHSYCETYHAPKLDVLGYDIAHGAKNQCAAIFSKASNPQEYDRQIEEQCYEYVERPITAATTFVEKRLDTEIDGYETLGALLAGGILGASASAVAARQRKATDNKDDVDSAPKENFNKAAVVILPNPSYLAPAILAVAPIVPYVLSAKGIYDNFLRPPSPL